MEFCGQQYLDTVLIFSWEMYTLLENIIRLTLKNEICHLVHKA